MLMCIGHYLVSSWWLTVITKILRYFHALMQMLFWKFSWCYSNGQAPKLIAFSAFCHLLFLPLLSFILRCYFLLLWCASFYSPFISNFFFLNFHWSWTPKLMKLVNKIYFYRNFRPNIQDEKDELKRSVPWWNRFWYIEMKNNVLHRCGDNITQGVKTLSQITC